MALTLTAANSIFMLSVTGLFDTPQQIQGFQADAAFATESVTRAEIVMGVDATLSAGWVPVERKQTLSIMPTSPSLDIFLTWQQAEDAIKELYFANATITLPSIGKKYTCTKGVLMAVTPIPEVRKMLQGVTYGLTWQSITSAPV